MCQHKHLIFYLFIKIIVQSYIVEFWTKMKGYTLSAWAVTEWEKDNKVRERTSLLKLMTKVDRMSHICSPGIVHPRDGKE